MALNDIIEKKRDSIVEMWLNTLFSTYHPKTAQFLENKRNKFDNPVGSAFKEAIGPLFDEIVGDFDQEKIRQCLDEIIRIRAVQDFIPSQAIGIFVVLKDVVRKVIPSKEMGPEIYEELFIFDAKVDRMALMAFDVYMACRERIWEIKLNDFKKRPIFAEGQMCLSYMLRRGLKHRQKRGEVEQFTDIRPQEN